MSNVQRLQPLVGTVMLIDDALVLPSDIMEELGWEESVLLELEFVNERWILTQSKVAASKFSGHILSDEIQRSN